MTTPARPNVLIIFADQLRADALGCYGNTIVATPALDSLARQGTVFDSAYTPSPVCVPSRSAFITGLEPQHGDCFENEMPTASASTFMDDLTAAGYRTHGIGKMHFTPDITALRGFQSREIGEEFGTAETDDYLRFVEEHGFEFVEHPHGLRDEMYYVPQLSPVPEHLHHSHWVADRSVAFLESHAGGAGEPGAADDGTPFLLWSSFIAPHPPFAPPSPWHRRFEPSTMPDPFVPQGSESLETIYNRLQNRYKYRDGGHDRRLEQLRTAYYYASVSYLDTQVARILAALDASGERENTIVVVTADHGEFLGDYGFYGKRSFLDAAARVPLIISGPGFEAERMPHPVSLVDVRATLLEATGTAGDPRDGRSVLAGDEPGPVYGQYQQGDAGLYAVITEEWKYIWSAFDRREFLLDRVRDPRESANLAYNPRRRDTLVAMRDLARTHFADLADADFDTASSNVSLRLGMRPDDETLRSMAALELDAEAATLVVRGGPWSPERD
ncbi:arylsulfatase A-like enzyme [Agromyces terreus]|uniref:Arylsulfatase A-like enzyme n=1 Tax=Agromyces terreus TaxID=424795 RepID=A0A9X2GVW6_9MICO|nr:sulfatase-like hydrolase/transferase [Agromyces terreus]MCP2369622.1 arylsulfatase A-like enzyme [Agromyces terreus]